jgi:hypothetical protein
MNDNWRKLSEGRRPPTKEQITHILSHLPLSPVTQELVWDSWQVAPRLPGKTTRSAGRWGEVY